MADLKQIRKALVRPENSEPVEAIVGANADIYDNDHISLGRKVDSQIGENSVAIGQDVIASGNNCLATGVETLATVGNSHAEGFGTTAGNNSAHAEGHNTLAEGAWSHAEGENTQAIGDGAHAEGKGTIAEGNYSHAEGNAVQAIGDFSHAEGQSFDNKTYVIVTLKQEINQESTKIYYTLQNNTLIYPQQGDYLKLNNKKYPILQWFEGNSFACSSEAAELISERDNLYIYSDKLGSAQGQFSHSEGYGTQAIAANTHTEGYLTVATKDSAHAEGAYTQANGVNSHAEGRSTQANGSNSHAEGKNTIANGDGQFVAGRFNKPNTSDIFQIGCGTGSGSASKNAFWIDSKGIAHNQRKILEPSLLNFESNFNIYEGGGWIDIERVGDTVFFNCCFGTVKIINYTEPMASFKIGEITDPDFIPYRTNYFLCHGSGFSNYLFTIQPDSEVKASLHMARYFNPANDVDTLNAEIKGLDAVIYNSMKNFEDDKVGPLWNDVKSGTKPSSGYKKSFTGNSFLGDNVTASGISALYTIQKNYWMPISVSYLAKA